MTYLQDILAQLGRDHEIAKAVGVTRPTVWKWRHGALTLTVPRMRQIMALAREREIEVDAERLLREVA